LIKINDIRYLTLFESVTTYCDIPESEWLFFESILVRKEYKKGQLFINQGQDLKLVGFSLSGSFRQYFTLENDKEINYTFNFENQLISDYKAFICGHVAELSIIAMEPSILLTLTVEQCHSLFDRHKCWDRFGRKMAERYYVEKAKLERAYHYMSALERYKYFISFARKDITERVPQYHIANFLEISPEALSRALKKNK
jgi:CRP-like cAMP-binding protein